VAGGRNRRDPAGDGPIAADLTEIFRDQAGRLVAGLTRRLGDFDLAEESVQEAVIEAIQHWPHDGVPERPDAWLATVARRKALDRIRRDVRHREKLEIIEAQPLERHVDPEDRLRLMFVCCHPALSRDVQVALTLRAVVGLTTAEIARALLSTEDAIAQRIVRAKRKIVDAGIAFRVPDDSELVERLEHLLAVIYLLFNEGYLTTGGPQPARRDLADDAEWLAALLTRLLPTQPEPLGLLALIRLHLARAGARFDAAGNIVLFEDQDRSLWDREAIAAAIKLLERAAAFKQPGPYQVQAAIAAVYAESPTWADTDWAQALALYDLLVRLDPSPVARLNRAIALERVVGAAAALDAVDDLRGDLDSYHLFHATRGRLLEQLGQAELAASEYRMATAQTSNPAERALLARRLEQLRHRRATAKPRTP
jgi:RNA polymerase sigma factor (sigma-70 family)